jgi:putative membrane protein
MYFLFKSLHIIGFVSWFAGLFYLVRIFVYQVESWEKSEPDRSILSHQFDLMAYRVYTIICKPALYITWVFGLGMLWLNGLAWLSANSWMFIKLIFLVGLTFYHFWCGALIPKLEKRSLGISSFQFRMLNEVPTLFLVAISLLAVYKNSLDFLIALGGIILFGITLFVATKAYKRARDSGSAR